MRGLRFISTIPIPLLWCCSPASQTPRYDFNEKDGSYKQCEFFGDFGDTNDKIGSDKGPRPYFHVTGHGYEKKISGVWLPFVHQWRSKNGRVITFVARDGTGSGDTSGYWYGTMNGQRAGGYTIVPRYHWAFKTWNGTAEFECRHVREERGG